MSRGPAGRGGASLGGRGAVRCCSCGVAWGRMARWDGTAPVGGMRGRCRVDRPGLGRATTAEGALPPSSDGGLPREYLERERSRTRARPGGGVIVGRGDQEGGRRRARGRDPEASRDQACGRDWGCGREGFDQRPGSEPGRGRDLWGATPGAGDPMWAKGRPWGRPGGSGLERGQGLGQVERAVIEGAAGDGAVERGAAIA